MSSALYPACSPAPPSITDAYPSSSYIPQSQRQPKPQANDYFFTNTSRYRDSNSRSESQPFARPAPHAQAQPSQPPQQPQLQSQLQSQEQSQPKQQPQGVVQQNHQQPQTQQVLPAINTAMTVVLPSSRDAQLPSSSLYSTKQPGSKAATGPSTPTGSIYLPDVTAGRRGSNTATSQGPTIPPRISSSGGLLSHFAAQMTCFFWFESLELLASMDKAVDSPSPIPPLTKLAVAHINYMKWVQSMIATTQVSQNVVLLAIMFVNRLKHATRQVNPQPGSEYRLLVVALMLGNKFLDDNTYTNKTWAEVSGITVGEIHVMEVEFLSNMRYNLYSTAEDWEKWLDQLKVAYEYYERAKPRQPSPITIPSPTRAYGGPVLLSSTPSPNYAPAMSLPATAPSLKQPSVAPNWPYSGTSPLSAKPTLGAEPLRKKRSFEGDPTEPPPKRMSARPSISVPSLSSLYPASSSILPAVSTQSTSHDSIRLPVPTLTVNTQLAPVSQAPATVYPAQPTLSLPPLTQGVRAMSTVYATSGGPLPCTAPTTTSSSHALPITVAASSAGMPVTTAPAYAPGYHTPTKRQSPTNMLHPPFASSPLENSFPNGPHTPLTQSPSFYLQQRQSPYRPIRHVNTLLYPPPSASLHEYHLTPSQMHYQPLGRRNDVRTGIVPEYRLRNPQPPGPAGYSPGYRGPAAHQSSLS